MTPTGTHLIAGEARAEGCATFTATDPRTGAAGTVAYPEANASLVAEAAAAAAEAFRTLRDWPAERLATLLRTVADRLEARGDDLVALADAETGLGRPRLEGELGRTTGQFRSFAKVLEAGWHVEAVISTGDASATPPRPDVRRLLHPIGPVAVFGASNFPLAFSVPGGDTASVIAAGCSVVVKAHPSHPGTSELAGRAITEAVAAAGAPAGTFSLVHGREPAVGEALVTDPRIRAVGFTGSLQGGRALADLAAARPEPIPVYAEMGSLNPVFVTAAALGARAQAIAEGFAASMTMGTGQFCTKPGIVFVPPGPDGERFAEAVAAALRGRAAEPMLNPGIRTALGRLLDRSRAQPGVRTLVAGEADGGPGCLQAPSLLATDLDTLLAQPGLREEHFGPVALIVWCPPERFADAARGLPGSLTATVHLEDADVAELAPLVADLRERAGRLVVNGFPTGVAVVEAMHHGGPYPATTYPAFTSVGAFALRRFQRPVAYQDVPQALLPEALRDANPLRLLRLVDGSWTTAPVNAPR